MSININAVETCTDILECLTTEAIWLATLDDEYIGMLSNYMMYVWQFTKYEVQKEAHPYFSFRDEVMDRIAMKGRGIKVPASL